MTVSSESCNKGSPLLEEQCIVVIGGGPAGLTAAARAASLGAPVLLLERTARLGTKLRLSGGGRCNLTNTAPIDDFLAHFGHVPFLRNALARFSPKDLVAFLETLGLPIQAEPDGRVFPASGSAHEVADTLADYARRQGVRVRLHSRVTGLVVREGRLRGIRLEGGEEIAACAAVLATGGASYPKTGSTGDGYRLAAAAGHAIVAIHPALVPLLVPTPEPKVLQGISLRGAGVRLLLDGQEIARAAGDVLFTHYGLSGPAILAVSGAASARMGRGNLEIALSLRPAQTPESVYAELLAARQTGPRRAIQAWLKQLAPPRLVDVILRRAGIDPAKQAGQLTSDETGRLRALLQDLRFPISGHRSWDEAMLTAGGVDTREVDPRTMESRLVPGLYLAGEVLDVQADTGGYNLQAAFSTGWTAGMAAAHHASDDREGQTATALPFRASSQEVKEKAGARGD